MTEDELQRRHVLKCMAAGAVASLLSPTAGSAVERAPTVVETSLGKAAGERVGSILTFKGLPYGADTAQTRFSAARPAEPWTGVRDATRFGPRAPQAERTIHPLAQSWTDRSPGESEECLFLNIWTPGTDPMDKRPVMVWIHGGGFSSGSGANTVNDGARLAERGDVVVITLNHRLNIFGYLYLAEIGGEDFADSGTAGLHDIVLALKWIRDNVAAFGGDPDNVTMFGESGGAAKISLVMGMPSAKGLFHKVILQSGSYLKGMTKDAATRAAEGYLHDVGVTPRNVADLRRVPMDKLVEALGSASKLADRIAFMPCTDGRGLPRHPFEPDATPLAADIPMIVGNTRWEYIYQLGQENDSYFQMTMDELPDVLSETFSALSIPADPMETLAAYREYYPEASASDILFLTITDGRMLRRSLQQVERQFARSSRVYMYMIEWHTPIGGGRWKSPHAVDVPLVFDNVEHGRSMTGVGPEAHRLAARMSEAWIEFARSGEPQTSLLPDWPQYDLDRRATMMFDTRCRVENDPAPEKRRYWVG